MSVHHDPHTGLHSEQGALAGEHRGRAAEPIIKVHDLAWLEFEKPDLERAEAFAHAFGFTTALRTAHELQLRGTDPGSPCVLIRRGPRSRFVGPAHQDVAGYNCHKKCGRRLSCGHKCEKRCFECPSRKDGEEENMMVTEGGEVTELRRCDSCEAAVQEPAVENDQEECVGALDRLRKNAKKCKD